MGRKIYPEVIMADYTPDALREGELAGRRKCFHCGSPKSAWCADNQYRGTGHMRCRVCGAQWWVMA